MIKYVCDRCGAMFDNSTRLTEVTIRSGLSAHALASDTEGVLDLCEDCSKGIMDYLGWPDGWRPADD